MFVSLFDSVLQAGEKNLLPTLNLPAKSNPQNFKLQYQRNLLLAELIFTICQETTTAVMERRYQSFDALLKNFGCQVTVLQNYLILKQSSLHEEAKKVHALIPEKIALVQQAIRAKPLLGERGMSVANYLKLYPDLQVEISPTMAQLVRFRVLEIVNDHTGDDPKTVLDPLYARINGIAQSYYLAVQVPFKSWIENLQVEESAIAVAFIQSVTKENSALLDGFNEVLKATSVRSGIQRMPQFHSGEIMLRSLTGVVVLKPMKGSKGETLFVAMPKERFLSKEEVDQLPSTEPLVVLEGTIHQPNLLVETVRRVGIIALLNATTADLDPMTVNQENEQHEEIRKVMVMDHTYCSSVREALQ